MDPTKKQVIDYCYKRGYEASYTGNDGKWKIRYLTVPYRVDEVFIRSYFDYYNIDYFVL